ncbi:hypothetical protein Forpe1208_v014797 [Fusarium oxysporum f. sp. rapae]|uniref:Uncharacterized protein n=1 Tax=Fusarium oxysporum f. sp. rapae TaxID=485398 RepID=A0A8J5NI38_FUSOX|nr:hypothetical protein Forpe1208_v014797 [Fusarium oxysporum f. sp. rapae]
MPEPVSQNKHSLRGEAQGVKSESEQGQSDENDFKEDKLSQDEAKEKSTKKVRFQEDSQIKDPEKKRSHNEANHKVSAPTSSNISLWDAETIKELNNCLIEAKTTLKRVQERVKELEDRKKALLEEEKDLQNEVDMFKKSIKKKRSLALFVDLP